MSQNIQSNSTLTLVLLSKFQKTRENQRQVTNDMTFDFVQSAICPDSLESVRRKCQRQELAARTLVGHSDCHLLEWQLADSMHCRLTFCQVSELPQNRHRQLCLRNDWRRLNYPRDLVTIPNFWKFKAALTPGMGIDLAE
jgi:hypothetical protein